MLKRTPRPRGLECKSAFRTAPFRTRHTAVPMTPGWGRSRSSWSGCQTPWDPRPPRSRLEPVRRRKCLLWRWRTCPRRVWSRPRRADSVRQGDEVIRDRSCVAAVNLIIASKKFKNIILLGTEGRVFRASAASSIRIIATNEARHPLYLPRKIRGKVVTGTPTRRENILASCQRRAKF